MLAVVAAPAMAGEVDVQANGDRLNLRTKAAPLSEILDRLARHTGMKIVYDGPPPRQNITATLLDRTPAEALLGVLEGQGLSYAFVMDRSVTRVQTVIITTTRSSPVTSAAPMHRPPDQEEVDDMPEEEPPPGPPDPGDVPHSAHAAPQQPPGAQFPGAPMPGVPGVPQNPFPFTPNPVIPGIPGLQPQPTPPPPPPPPQQNP